MILFTARIFFFSMNKGSTVLTIGAVFFVLWIVSAFVFDALFSNAVDNSFLVSMFKNYSIYYSLIHSTLVPMFIEYIYICGIRSNLIYPAYKLIVSKYKSKDLSFFTKNGREKLSKLLRHKAEFQLSSIVKQVYNGIKSIEIEDDVKKILSMDSNNFNLGINQFTCNIIDPNDHRRFAIFNTKKQVQLGSFLLSVSMIFAILELIVVNITDPLHNSNYYFDTPIPYVFLILLIPYYTSSMEKYLRSSSTIAKVAIVTILIISLLLMGLQIYPMQYSIPIVIRFLSGPYMIDFVFNAISILVYFGAYLLRVFKPGELTMSELFVSGRFTFITSFFMFRIFVLMVVRFIYYLILKHKYDSMIKGDYLAKIRIKNEYVISTEKLEILMPKFVLNRIDSFTMSRKF